MNSFKFIKDIHYQEREFNKEDDDDVDCYRLKLQILRKSQKQKQTNKQTNKQKQKQKTKQKIFSVIFLSK